MIQSSVPLNRSTSSRYQSINQPTRNRSTNERVGRKISSMSVNCSRASEEAEPLKSSSCVVCKKIHKIEKCPLFQAGSVRQRSNIIRVNKLCLNCLDPNHFVAECKSKMRCSSCSGKHHSLLHKERSVGNSGTADPGVQGKQPPKTKGSGDAPLR